MGGQRSGESGYTDAKERLLAVSDAEPGWNTSREERITLYVGSDSGSGESSGVNICCQTCVTVCQADCCYLAEQYRSWEPPKLVEPVMFLLYFAFGLYLPLMLTYINERLWDAADPEDVLRQQLEESGVEIEYFHDSVLNMCRMKPQLVNNLSVTLQAVQTRVQGTSAQWELLLALARNIPSIFVSLAVGSYGDVIGRRFGLFLPALGGFVSSAVAIAIFDQNLAIKDFLFANLSLGMFGGLACASGCAYAYMADTVPDDRRTLRYSVLASLKFAAVGLASLSNSYFINFFGFQGTCWIILILYLIAAVSILFILPESYDRAKNRKVTDFSGVALCISAMLPFSLYAQARQKPHARAVLLVLLVVNFMESCVAYGRLQVVYAFLIGPPFCSSDLEVGLARSFTIFLSMISPFVANKTFAKWLPDPGVGAITALLAGLGLAAQGLAQSDPVLYLTLFLQMFLPLSHGISRSIMSKLVEPEEQGALQASVTSARDLGSVLSSVLSLVLFNATVEIFPGTVFVILGMINIIAMLGFVIVWGLQRHPSKKLKPQDRKPSRKEALESYLRKYTSTYTASEGRSLTLAGDEDDEDDDDVFLN